MCGDDSGEAVSLPEWSKGLRSGRNVFERVGSNPTADKSFAATTTKSCHACSHAVVSAAVCWSYTVQKDKTPSRLMVRRRSFHQAAQHLLDTLPTTLVMCCLIIELIDDWQIAVIFGRQQQAEAHVNVMDDARKMSNCTVM